MPAGLRAFLDRIAPPGHVEELRSLREEISQVWKAFLRGQLVLAFAVGTAVWLLMTIVACRTRADGRAGRPARSRS